MGFVLLWKQQQGYETWLRSGSQRARRRALTHAGRERTGGKRCHGPAPRSRDTHRHSHRGHGSTAATESGVSCNGNRRDLEEPVIRDLSAGLYCNLRTGKAVTPSRSSRTRGGESGARGPSWL